MEGTWTWTEGSGMKVCFVTTGATAPFTGLIESVLQPSSIDSLHTSGYTHLLVQYGTAKDIFDRQVIAARTRKSSLTIGGFDFDRDGLKNQFKLVQQSKGLAISHAGSGSILEALRYQVPLIVVPNTLLLDNHQEELAVAMERSGYLLQGNVKDLAPAIIRSENFKNQNDPVSSNHQWKTP